MRGKEGRKTRGEWWGGWGSGRGWGVDGGGGEGGVYDTAGDTLCGGDFISLVFLPGRCMLRFAHQIGLPKQRKYAGNG